MKKTLKTYRVKMDVCVHPQPHKRKPGRKYTIQEGSIQSREEVYNPGRKYTTHGGSIQPREEVYNPGRKYTNQGGSIQYGDGMRMNADMFSKYMLQ
jgi:hypothetical protein